MSRTKEIACSIQTECSLLTPLGLKPKKMTACAQVLPETSDQVSSQASSSQHSTKLAEEKTTTKLPRYGGFTACSSVKVQIQFLYLNTCTIHPKMPRTRRYLPSVFRWCFFLYQYQQVRSDLPKAPWCWSKSWPRNFGKVATMLKCVRWTKLPGIWCLRSLLSNGCCFPNGESDDRGHLELEHGSEQSHSRFQPLRLSQVSQAIYPTTKIRPHR